MVRSTTSIQRAVDRTSTPIPTESISEISNLSTIVVSPFSSNSTRAATQALSITLMKCPGAKIGRSEIPIAKQVSPGRTVITENPTAPIISSAVFIALNVGLFYLNLAMFHIAKFIDFD